MNNTYRHSDGFEYRELPLDMGLSLMPQNTGVEWRGYHYQAYTPRLREILQETLGRVDFGIEGFNVAQVTLHPRYWCSKSLLPVSKLSSNVRKILTCRDWDWTVKGDVFVAQLSGLIETQLSTFVALGSEDKLTVSKTRLLFSNAYHILRKYLRIMAHTNTQKMKPRIETLEETLDGVKRRWASIEASVNRGDFFGHPPTASEYWYEARKHLKTILSIQRDMKGYGQWLSQSKREMLRSYFECQGKFCETFDKYDPGHKGLCLAELDGSTR